ncbi:hypothetical protein ASG52_01055 [Methylobacterium sp. Leaf456]|uniref:hypothetical protein n=1 Tax=Methylobacterium sp. Leaf456 TaxID=1736382 RepID=UPI0006FC6617|nr:hypothetical protein [Methylobacterium sp. Leaf456]KQT61507.1 hypothetical protein ASG52_01055 [Methylobacterium sp. Leaf456]
MSVDERGAAARKALGAKTAAGYFLDPARRPLAAFVVGAACLTLVAWLDGLARLAPSYLAAWTCLLALPAGALPVAIMIERADAWRPQPETALLETLRGLLALMPVAALLALPIPFLAPLLYPWTQGTVPDTPFAALWFSGAAFAVRLAVYFALWIGLALLFARRGGEPWGKAGRIDDGRAVLGLGLHTVVGTLAADDLVMAVDGRFHAAAFGLLAMAAWSSLALAAAVLIAPPDIGPARRRHDRMTPLAVLLLVSAGLHAVQFLMLGSDPAAASWYGVRGGSAGRALMLVSGLLVALAAALTLRPGENRTRFVAAFVVAAHLAEMAWFVTPSFAGKFRIGMTDLLALAGVAGLAMGLTPPLRRLFPGLAVTPAWPGREAARRFSERR